MIQANSPPEIVLGCSAFARELRAQLPRLAAARLPLLIEGETGTGKSTLAAGLHRLSPRALAPYQVVDCGSLPETLFTRELFGHVRGAYTGAEGDGVGRLVAADGGTVLLHGVHDLARPNQAALLRVLEEGEVVPLGAIEPCHVDLRFVQTSQVSVEKLVEEGRLRSDLYYRMRGTRVEIPPLRERPDDLAMAIEQFLRSESIALRRNTPTLYPELRKLLERYSWPGNLRQLQHTLRGMLTLSEADTLGVADLPPELRAEVLEDSDRSSRDDNNQVYSIPSHLSFREQVDFFQRVLLQRAWRRSRRDRGRLMHTLRLAPHQLKYLIKKFDLNLD